MGGVDLHPFMGGVDLHPFMGGVDLHPFMGGVMRVRDSTDIKPHKR